MKKLMFATALVASIAALGIGSSEAMAAPLNATSFEGYTNGAPVSISQEETDAGEQINSYFTFDGDNDSSVVKTNGGENAAVPASEIRPKYYADSAVGQGKYLALDTEGGTLWRALALDTTSFEPVPKAVAADGTYLDTLVQFTVTEDEEPQVESGDKLAIWLQAGNGVTNLMVKAGFIDDDGTSTSQTPTNYILTTQSPVQAGTWYRLTVKAIADVTKCMAKNPEAYASGYTGFEIYLDGVLLTANSSAFGQGYIDLATDAGEYGWLDQTDDADFLTYLQSGKVFPALGLPTTSATLTGVGFKGTGAVDDIVWTEENPIEAPAPAYPDYLETADSTIKGKYDDWKTTYSADTASMYENEFLVNANPATTTVTSNALEITEIKENTTDGGWDITIGCSVAGVDLTGTVGSTIVCNGYLAVSYTDDLAGIWTTENIAVTEVDATTGTVTVNVNKSGAKFMKVSLTVAPQPAANN